MPTRSAPKRGGVRGAARVLLLAVAAWCLAAPAFAALDVSMSIAPPSSTYKNPIDPGDVTAFRITVTNSDSAAPITGVTFTDTIDALSPGGLVVAGAGVVTYTCFDPNTNLTTAGAGTVTAVVGGNTISLAGGVIPAAKASGASGACDIDVEVTSMKPGTSQLNRIPAGGVTGNAGAISNGSPAAQSITVNSLTAPTLTKAFSSATVVKSDQPTTLTITIDNGASARTLPLNGVGDTPPFAIRDLLPAGLEVAPTPNASAHCVGGTDPNAFTPAAGETTLTVTGGVAAAHGTCVIKVDVVGVTATGTSDLVNHIFSTAIVNTISRTADFGNRRGLVPAADATATLTVRSALGLAKLFFPGTVAAGQSADLVITFTNASPFNAITLDAVDALTEAQIDGDASPTSGLLITGSANTCGSTVTVNGGGEGFTVKGGAVPVNASCTVTLHYTATLAVAGTPHTYTNDIPQGAVTNNGGVVSPEAAASVNVVDQLTVSKSVAPSGAAPGNPVRYIVTINNFTGGTLTNVKVTDVLPSDVTLLASLPAPPTLGGSPCTGLSQDAASTAATPVFVIATFNGASSPDPTVCTITFWAQTPQNGTSGTVLTNSIAGGGVTGTDAGNHTVTNASGSGGVNVTLANVITVNKSFAPATAFEGTVSQLTAVFTNIGAQPITAASFTDNLPLSGGAQLIVASPANASTTCVGGTVTATPGAASITVTGATIPARASNGTGANGTCTATVSVIGGAGTYVNTLPASALTGTQTYADTTTHTAASPGPVLATLTYQSALTALKAFSPATIAAGGVSTVTITLGNVGAGTLNNVSVTDPLPTNLLVAAQPAGQTTCGGAPVITAVAGAATAGLTGAVIPASGQCTFQFNVTGTGGSAWVNTIPAGNVTATGGVRNVSAVTATLLNSSAGGVSVTNNATPNSLTSPGQVSVLTLTLTNGGSVDLSGLALTDYYTDTGLAGGALTGMINSGAPGGATTCPGGVATAAPGGTSVALTGASLAHGASCTVTVNVTLNTTGTIQNKVPVGAITDSQGVSNTLPTTTSLSASANIGVTKRFTPTVVKPGERSRLQITLINPTAQALSNVSATDNLPSGLVVPSGPNASTTCVGATVSAPTATQVTVTGGSLPAASGGSSAICIAEIDVVAASAGTYLNTIAAGQVAATLGGAPVMNPVPAPATLEVRSPVAIAKAFNANAVGLGVPSVLTITLTNPNTVPLTAAALADALPANVSVALTPNASTTCAGGVVTAPVSATTIQLTGGVIPASGACTVTVSVVSNVAGIYVNTIPAGALATAQGVTNENPATDTLRIINPPTVFKQFSPTSIPAGGASTLTIVLGNTNVTAATLSADLIDTLPTSPAAIVVASPNGLGGTCPGATVAVAGAATVKYPSGAAIPAGGCTIVVNVTGAADGVYTNTIPVGALQTNLGNNVQPTNADLTISPLGFISGKVFRDNNVTPNGTFEIAVDAPISGVAINLTGTDYGPDAAPGGGDDIPVSRSTVTDALGNYAFTGLNAGSYTITEPTQPSGTNNGVTTAGAVTGGGGGSSGAATAVGTVPSAVTPIVLLKNGGGAVASSPGNNFAEVAPSSIAGQVFLDQDDNGVRNAPDTALVGVTLQLLNVSNTVVATTVTDAAGAYVFSGLAPGTYTVREPAQPSGTANGKTNPGAVGNGGSAGTATLQTVVPSQISGIVLPPGTAAAANDFAEVPAGRQVSGRVFIDSNNDGVFNGSDAGLSGVQLNLTGTDFNSLPVSATTTTGADGRYVFAGLAAGTYTVTEPSQPASTSNGVTTVGSTGGLATATSVVPSAISSINLTGPATLSSNNDFGEIFVPAPPAPTTGVSGTVYIDQNNNGAIDPGDDGISAVTVTLTGSSSTGQPVSLTTTTAAGGGYVFAGVPPSNPAGYTVTETQPAAYTDGKTTVTPGLPGAPTAGKPVAAGGTDTITGVIVTVGQLAGYNFGELAPGGSVAGFVYVDGNDNGVKDPGEAGLPGVTVILSGTNSTGAAVQRTATTGADGGYIFTGLPASNPSGYTVTETQPVNYADGKTTVASGNPGAPSAAKPVAGGGGDPIGGVVVTATSTLTNYNFGEKADGAISGHVYRDANGDGLRQTGEDPVAGVTIRLTGTDVNGQPVDRTIVTDAAGAYAFTGLVASNGAGYVIAETQPATYTDGSDSIRSGNPGVIGGGKPVAVGGLDLISGVVLPTHGQLTDYDFGELRVGASVAGYVYADANNNGVRDPGEAAIPGVSVRLTGTDINGAAVSISQVTGADGAFFFSVPPSNGAGYTLTETQPAGFTDGKTNVASGNSGGAPSHKPVGVGDNDQIAGIVLTGGAALTDYRFGEVPVPLLKPPIVNGYVYLDRNHTRVRPTNGTEEGQAGWTVVLKQNGAMICVTTTDATGFYQFDNLHCPGYEISGLPTGSGFSITFSKDGNSLPAVPTSGDNRGQVPPTGGQILNITLTSADRVVEQNLPLDPAGVVYNSVTRQPVQGAQVTITGPAGFDPATQLVGGLAAMTQTVGADGLYQFLLQNNFPTGVYTLAVTAPAGYMPAPSTSLPPCVNTLTVGLAVNPALIQASDFAPGGAVTPQTNTAACPGLVAGGATTTQYFLTFLITNGGSAPILNNHIPLDPILGGALLVTKTTPVITTSRGALVPYTITATNSLAAPLANVSVRDQLPPGFVFRTGSATRNGASVSPTVANGVVTWPAETFAPKEKKTYSLVLVVGAGVGDADYVNRAFVAGATGTTVSNIASATVRITPDPTFDCPDIIGKVFDDRNANGYQDQGEPGIPGVRMATPDGLLVTSDAEGRFHVPCPATPNPDRGSNFVMKLDERSLPSGFRLTTENPRDVRITRGKLSKLNFGATIHRVVRIELAAEAFDGDSIDLKPNWKGQTTPCRKRFARRPPSSASPTGQALSPPTWSAAALPRSSASSTSAGSRWMAATP